MRATDYNELKNTDLESLSSIKEKRDSLNKLIEAKEALIHLRKIWYNETLTCSFFGEPVTPVFSVLYPMYYARQNELLKQLKSKALYFRDLDDSNKLPEWRFEAYRQAKVFQDFYNSEENKNNTYFY